MDEDFDFGTHDWNAYAASHAPCYRWWTCAGCHKWDTCESRKQRCQAFPKLMCIQRKNAGWRGGCYDCPAGMNPNYEGDW